MQSIKSNNNNHAYNKILKDINIHLNESNKEDSFVFLNDILDDDDDDIDGY